MPTQQLDYTSSQSTSGVRRRVTVACAIVAAVILLLNTFLMIEVSTGGWGALMILWCIGPIANFIVGGISAACAGIVKQMADGAPVRRYVQVCVLLPILAILSDFAIASTMELHIHGS
jgi:hypothetical protein